MGDVRALFAKFLGTGKELESIAKKDPRALEMAARLLAAVSDWHQERLCVQPGVPLEALRKTFQHRKEFEDIEYCWSLHFDPSFFAELCYEGFLSICSFPGRMAYVLLPWLAPDRCLMDYPNIRVSSKTRKRAKKYTVTVNQDFDGVVAACVKQHGESWLHPPMRDLLRALAKGGYKGGQRGLCFGVHSIELWDSNKRLVAGDLGYTVGGCYTSMTGFRAPGTQSAGTVQLVATAALLRRLGFSFWDLGMVMKYKTDLGGTTVTRDQYVDRFIAVRDKSDCELREGKGVSARALIDSELWRQRRSAEVDLDTSAADGKRLATRSTTTSGSISKTESAKMKKTSSVLSSESQAGQSVDAKSGSGVSGTRSGDS